VSHWLAETASVAPVDWLPQDAKLQHAISRGTYPGCHGDDGPGELPRRSQVMRARLCGAQ